MPSEEEERLKALNQKRVEIHKIKIKANKMQAIENQLQKIFKI